MSSGEFKLFKKGAQNLLYTGNPATTFFKEEPHKHTLFDMKMIEVTPETRDFVLLKNRETKLEFTIGHIDSHITGDLIKHMFFVFNLPNIYSNNTYKFKWINRIGEYIIKEATFFIDGQRLDTLTGEWINIWNELYLDETKKDNYNTMIGNVSSLYNPLEMDGTTYPETNHTTLETFTRTPSILENKIIVPLPFYFAYQPGSEFPICCINKTQKITLKLLLRPFTELFTILNPNDTPNPSRGRITEKEELSQFTNFDDYVNVVAGNPPTIKNTLDIKPSLEINYIFLKNDEKERIKNNRQIYRIRQINRIPVVESNQFSKFLKINLKNLNKISSQIIWIIRRSDFEDKNQWFNFTNWADTNTDPLRNNNSNFNEFNSSATDTITTLNYDSLYNKHLFESVKILFNRNVVVDEGYEYFLYTDKNTSNNIYQYNFQEKIKNKQWQPNGVQNLSMLASCIYLHAQQNTR